ncbi:MAG: hypothetical protein ABIQ12_01600 [Opitutaceae bacterium]
MGPFYLAAPRIHGFLELYGCTIIHGLLCGKLSPIASPAALE